ncbi:hypothetical protein JL721_10956 [Aureococcus anophagefferens]|nr:hypothetical protein JL721_10956 [Aureococcus anophagefferens]
MTPQALVQLVPGPAEVTSLVDWRWEATCFRTLRSSFKFFRYARELRCFFRWRNYSRVACFERLASFRSRFLLARESFCGPTMDLLSAAHRMRTAELLDLSAGGPKEDDDDDASEGAALSDDDDDERARGDYAAERNFEQDPLNENDADSLFEAGVRRDYMYLCPAARTRKKALRAMGAARDAAKSKALKVSEPAAGRPLIEQPKKLTARARRVTEEKKKSQGLMRAIDIGVFEKKQELAIARGGIARPAAPRTKDQSISEEKREKEERAKLRDQERDEKVLVGSLVMLADVVVTESLAIACASMGTTFRERLERSRETNQGMFEVQLSFAPPALGVEEASRARRAAGEERRDTGGTVFTPNCTEVRETASFVVHGAVEVVDNIVSIKSMWPFCDDLRASKAGDAAAMAARARGDSERRIHKARGSGGGGLEGAESRPETAASRGDDGATPPTVSFAESPARGRARPGKLPHADGRRRARRGPGAAAARDAPTPGTPPGSAGVADTTLHGGDGDGDIYMQSLEDSFRPNSRQSNGAVARIMRTKKAFQRDLKAIDREIRESFHEGTTWRARDARRSAPPRGGARGSTRSWPSPRSDRGLLDEQPQVLRAYAKHAATVVSTRAFGWSALHAIAKAAKRVAELTASEAIASDAFDPTVAGEDMMGLEEKEAEQKQLALLLGDDAQKLSFETKLYLTELRDEEKSQKRAELAHISWRTGRLRSAHQEVDSEVHKCGNQAASLARALSGPRFAAAENDRAASRVRAHDGPEAAHPVERREPGGGDPRTGSSNEQMKKMLPRGVSEGLLKGSDDSSNGSREAAPDAIKSKNEHAASIWCSRRTRASVFFGRSQLLWTMITRWQDIHDSWVSQPLSSFDAEELDAESRLFARESTALEMRLPRAGDDADYKGVIHHAAGDEDEERTPGAAILPRAGGAARRLRRAPPAGTNGEPAAPDTIYELGPLDDVANLANDHRAAFRAIAMGEHGMALKPLITVWRQRLDRLTDALHAADDLDRKQRALKPMLAGEREGALAHAWARFNNVHNRWHELLKEIHGDPRPMRLIAPPAEAPEDPKQKEKRRSHKAPKHRARGGRPRSSTRTAEQRGDAPGETPEDARRRRDSAALAGFLNMPEPPSDLKLKQWKLDVEVLDEIKAELKDHLEMKRTLSHVVLALPALFDAVVTLDRSLEPESDGDANSANSSERAAAGSSELFRAKGAMSMLLGNLKEARPSLSDAEKRRKRSERKASKRRSGRKSATGRRRQKPQKIGALVDAHGERLILPNPVEVYGGVEVWLRELEREMREALRASFAAVVRRQRQEKKRSKRRTSRSPEAVAPCQITLLCERMRWTEDVGDALSTSFRQGPASRAECFAKYAARPSGRRAIREGAVRLAPGEEPPEFRDDERARAPATGARAPRAPASRRRRRRREAAPHMRASTTTPGSQAPLLPAGTLEARSRMSKIGGHIGRRTSEMIVPNGRVRLRDEERLGPVWNSNLQPDFNAEICKDLANTLMSRCVSRAPSDFGTQHENAVKAINHMFAGDADGRRHAAHRRDRVAAAGRVALNHSIAMILRPVVLAAPDVASVVAGTLVSRLPHGAAKAYAASLATLLRLAQDTELGERSDGAKGAQLQARWGLGRPCPSSRRRAILRTGDLVSMRRPFQSNQETEAEDERQERAALAMAAKRMLLRSLRNSGDDEATMTELIGRCSSGSEAIGGGEQIALQDREDAAARAVEDRFHELAGGPPSPPQLAAALAVGDAAAVAAASPSSARGLRQLADARAAAGGGDAWVVLDGNVERHWTEDLTVQLDRIADRADHGASPRRAVRQALREARGRVGRAEFKAQVVGAATLVAVADALDDLLEDCPLDDAIGLARRLDERRYFGFEYALEAKFDDDAPELPQHSSTRWGAADDGSGRARGVALIEAYERGAGASAVAAAFAARELAAAGGPRRREVASASAGTLLRNVLAKRLVGHRRRHEAAASDDLERSLLVAPEKAGASAGRRLLVVVDDVSVPLSTRDCPDYLRARHGTVDESAVDARGQRHLPPVAVAPPNSGLGAVFCGVVKASLVDRTRRGLDKDLEAAAGQALRVYVRMARFSRDRRAAHPPAPLCVWVRVAKGLRLLPSCHTTLSLRRGIAHELCRELRDGLVAAARPAFDAAVELEGLVPTDDLLVDDADPAVYGAPNAPVKHYSLVERDRKFTRAMREGAGHVAATARATATTTTSTARPTAVVAASREKNGVRAGRDPDTTWNEVIRRALFAAGGGEPTIVVIADSQWAHSGVTARRLDDLFSAVHTGTVADSRVFRPDDEARVVSDYLDAQIGAQGGNALAPRRGGAQPPGTTSSDLAPIAGDSNCAHPAARRSLAAVLPYAAVDRFDDPDEAGCEAAARRWLGVERRKDYDERLKGGRPSSRRGLAGLALSTASRSVTFGLRKFSERAATENLATEAEQAKLKANAAFQFTQNSSGLLRSCADVFDEVAPSPEEGWELFIRTDFPKLVGEWYGRACKAAARDFEDDNDDTPGDTHAEKRHAWAHGVAQAERADPSTVASSVRRMGQAGLAVGVPVSVWVRCCCAVWKALCVPQTLAAWASAQDARKADAAASEKHALELDAFEAAQVAEKAAKVAVVDARRFGAETDELAHELGRKHRTALGRFKEIESTLMRWDGRAAALAAQHAALPPPARGGRRRRGDARAFADVTKVARIQKEASFMAAIAARDDDDGLLAIAEDLDPLALSSVPNKSTGEENTPLVVAAARRRRGFERRAIQALTESLKSHQRQAVAGAWALERPNVLANDVLPCALAVAAPRTRRPPRPRAALFADRPSTWHYDRRLRFYEDAARDDDGDGDHWAVVVDWLHPEAVDEDDDDDYDEGSVDFVRAGAGAGPAPAARAPAHSAAPGPRRPRPRRPAPRPRAPRGAAPVAAPPAAPAASDVAAAPPAAAPAVRTSPPRCRPTTGPAGRRRGPRGGAARDPPRRRVLEPPDASLDSQPWMAMMSQISLDVTGESTVARLPRAARGRGRGGGRATSSRRSGQERVIQRRFNAALERRCPELGGLCAAVRDEPAAWRDALEGGQAPQLFFVPSNSGPPEA